MSKHKPGPWVAVIDINYDHFEIRAKDGRRIAVCAMSYPMSAGTHDANAKLIAAAPELLEILLELQDIVFLTRNNELHTLMEAAIAKAKGENPDE